MSENIETHLFRIVQEACKNSLRHAQANIIKISGSLAPHKADLLIEDDGTGFELIDQSGLSNILANRHFGLAGIMERAHIIRAKPTIESKSGIGTKIQISWVAEEIT
jgi:signal transduction histidine kinase